MYFFLANYVLLIISSSACRDISLAYSPGYSVVKFISRNVISMSKTADGPNLRSKKFFEVGISVIINVRKEHN